MKIKTDKINKLLMESVKYSGGFTQVSDHIANHHAGMVDENDKKALSATLSVGMAAGAILVEKKLILKGVVIGTVGTLAAIGGGLLAWRQHLGKKKEEKPETRDELDESIERFKDSIDKFEIIMDDEMDLKVRKKD